MVTQDRQRLELQTRQPDGRWLIVEAGHGWAGAALRSGRPRLHEFTGLVPNGLMGDICQGAWRSRWRMRWR